MKLKQVSAQMTKEVESATATFVATDPQGNEVPTLSFVFRSPHSPEVRELDKKHDRERTRLILSWGDITRLSDKKLDDFKRDERDLINRHFAERMRAAFVSAHAKLTRDDGSPIAADDVFEVMSDPKHEELQKQVALWYKDPRTFRPLATTVSVASPATNPLPQPLPASETSSVSLAGNSN
jgi:hypothetical protein